MAKVVLYTFPVFKKPSEHEQNDGFHQRNPFVYVSAGNAKGFVDRAGNNPEYSLCLRAGYRLVHEKATHMGADRECGTRLINHSAMPGCGLLRQVREEM